VPVAADTKKAEKLQAVYQVHLDNVNELRQQIMHLMAQYPILVHRMLRARAAYRLAAKKAGIELSQTWWEREIER